MSETEENYDWLTEILFEPIIVTELNDYARNDYEFKLTSIEPAVGKGDNYISQVTRVKLEVTFIYKLDRKPEIYNFIVKSSIALLKEFEEMGIFEKEIKFYEEIALNFQKFDDTITFMPKCYSITTQGRQIIILNDLTAMGFKMQNRLVGLDLEHCKIFYKAIAQFHAVGAAYYEKFGRYTERFHETVYRLESKPMFDKWSEMLYSEFLHIFDRYESLKPYREKFHKWKDGVFEAVCEIMSEKLDQFNVLNHGDCWLNNLLFSHDGDNKPIGLCFVDFQVTQFGTPAIDILYFFASSPSLEVREHHFDELLHIYHTSLTEHLKKYNYPKPIPSMRDLQMLILKYGILGPYFLNALTPFVVLDADDTRPTDVFLKDDEEGNTFRYNLYNSPRYIKTLEVALKFFDRKGILEF